MFANKFIKGCVIFAAFFLITACEDTNNQNSTPLQPKNVVTPPSSDEVALTNNIPNKEKEGQKQTTETAESTSEVFLSTNPKSEPQEGSFNCDDQIYLAIKFANHDPKLHQINISWKDPNDEERENNSFPFFVTKNESLAWASLKLHRSVGAGMLQWVNPAAGMEEFIGTWTVDVSVGDIVKESLNFEVLC